MNDTMRQALKHDGNCPELPQLLEAMELDPATAARREAELHLKTCPACQTEWSLFQQFEACEVLPEERDVVASIVQQVQASRVTRAGSSPAANVRSFRQRWLTPGWMGVAAIAMAALVMAIGIGSQWRARHASPVDETGTQVLRSQTVEIATPLQDIAEAPAEIAWKPVAGASSYSVMFTEVDGTRVFYTKVTSLSLPLPENTLTLLKHGRTLLLNVTAQDEQGRDIAHSGNTRIHLRSN
jgi:hypothetical protein